MAAQVAQSTGRPGRAGAGQGRGRDDQCSAAGCLTRVSELVAHEVEVPLSSQRHGDEADHLVEGNATVNARGGGAIQCHEVVHVLDGWVGE